MKKAAILLMMSSTAFAAQTVKQTTATTATSRLVSQSMTPEEQTPAPKTTAKSAAKKKTAPQAIRAHARVAKAAPQAARARAPQAPQAAAPQAVAPQQTTVVVRRAPKQALAATVPAADPGGIKAPTFGDWELKAQLRNTLTMANAEELQNEGGKNFGLSNEVRVGMKHKSGWGFALTGTYQTQNFADPAGDAGSNGDASLMLYHPSIIKNDTFDFHGIARLYAPTSETSREKGILSASYYGFLDMTFAKRLTATNLTIVRGFSQPTPGDTDAQSVIYNSLEFYHATTKSISLSFGGQFEADNSRSGTSTEFDLYPFIDFSPTPNLLIEPKYYFPVFVGGNRSVNASGAALNQTQAELFIKLSI